MDFSVGTDTLAPLSDRIQAIVNMSLPETKKELRSFLGTASFYRKFIPNFADIVAPINILLKKYSTNRLQWTSEQIERMELLKQQLINHPILRLPDYSKKFYLRTDASDSGLGAVLLQDHDDVLMPVAFASRTLLDREKRYSVIERECLEIVWSISKFKFYLYGTEFILQTDQQPLTYLKNHSGRLMRWSLSLQQYFFSLDYIKGECIVGADILSHSTT